MSMNYNEKLEAIREVLDSMREEEILSVHNLYCEEQNRADDHIYFTEELDEILCEKSPIDVINMAIHGDYHSSAEYFRFDGYGNIESITSSSLSAYIDTYDISEYLLDNKDSYFTQEIRDMYNDIDDLFTEWEDEDEDEEDEEADDYSDNTGFWCVQFELTLNGREVRWEDLSECTQEHIANKIKEGYTSGEIVE